MKKKGAWIVATGFGFAMYTILGAGITERSDLHFLAKALAQPQAKRKTVVAKETSEIKIAAVSLIRLYQSLISSQDRSTCAFTFTCSAFAVKAIGRYGIIEGVLMASDRLQRCSGLSQGYYPRDTQTGRMADLPLEYFHLGRFPKTKAYRFVPDVSSPDRTLDSR